ncbi:TIGR03086 family metal-binding protein [Mycobacterium sp. 94-17]|uniref:TIGR03086 family metal-binding protein n=1 Tax=Mycobacterium sp. 94-17 TaxID=2986147 RepID=UPI002D1F1CE0|nr:TIGR03086 family metal-binding protein [Mycobacterium sp. 94-17]MEB4212012.1 TIGR03086 family metal-binding protein [Mycobacterium sp. 94-17]
MTETAVDALGIARSELTPRLNAIATTDWDKATPCTEWNVRQLVNHVVGLHHRIAGLVSGGSRGEYIATREDDWIGSDHIAAWHEGIRALDEAINSAQSLDITVAYRVPLSARDAVGLTAFDTAVHTWDVSRAIGVGEQIDDGLADFALDFIRFLHSQPELATLFPFTEREPPEGATVQVRLLQLAGRDA